MITNNKEITANVHSIETFGAFDGPGVRYVLFLQGCPFQCQFCHNRDTWSTKQNKRMTVNEVLEDYEKYKHFYKTGGITVSGGEPLLQMGFLLELFKEAKKRGIHTVIDTSAACYNVRQNIFFKELMEYTDLILLDIKQINDEKHKILVGDSNQKVLDFARFLDELGIPVNTRHVLIPGVNNDEQDLVDLRKFLDTLNNIVKIDVLPYHTAGQKKWEEMGLVYPLDGVRIPTDEEVKQAESILHTDYKYYKI